MEYRPLREWNFVSHTMEYRPLREWNFVSHTMEYRPLCARGWDFSHTHTHMWCCTLSNKEHDPELKAGGSKDRTQTQTRTLAYTNHKIDAHIRAHKKIARARMHTRARAHTRPHAHKRAHAHACRSGSASGSPTQSVHHTPSKFATSYARGAHSMPGSARKVPQSPVHAQPRPGECQGPES